MHVTVCFLCAFIVASTLAPTWLPPLPPPQSLLPASPPWLPPSSPPVVAIDYIAGFAPAAARFCSPRIAARLTLRTFAACCAIGCNITDVAAASVATAATAIAVAAVASRCRDCRHSRAVPCARGRASWTQFLCASADMPG